MHFDDYQTAAARTLNPALTPSERVFDAAAGLAEEAGEVLGAIRKQLFQGRPLASETLREELGDALWCLAAVATASGISLGEVAEGNLEKLRRRHPAGFVPPVSPDSARRSPDSTSGPASPSFPDRSSEPPG